jgi:hypothetical protein
MSNETENTAQLPSGKGLGAAALLSKGNPPEKINARLFDLVRYMRAELYEADLITDEEYSWLCYEAKLAKNGKGSPSPRRLEDYDTIKAFEKFVWDNCKIVLFTPDEPFRYIEHQPLANKDGKQFIRDQFIKSLNLG